MNELENIARSHFSELFSGVEKFSVIQSDESITVFVFPTPDILSKTKMLVINVVDDEIQIPNIFIPKEFRNKRLGLSFIKKVYQLAKENNHQLYIVDLVPSFYNYLVKCNAQALDMETVLITEDTLL